mmetsp:Transcript_18067/g.55579  ORF Transcript_18067/g.55579 Transcript_18067/m.55579 type:complete len:428 (-) Transcript_18067:46-1329(-)
MAKLVLALALASAAAFMSPSAPRAAVAPLKAISTEAMIDKAKTDRLAHLEAQALDALSLAAENYERAVFPNAMIVGDCVITHLLGKLGFLESGKVKIMVVDTFHLFDSTKPFLDSLEKKYKFKAEVFGPADCEDKDVYLKKFGDKLWVADVEQYDKICKVEPFQRGLKTLGTDVMINGRRRDHGAERAYIDIAEVAPIGGGLAKLNPLAYWTLEDCFDYAAANGVPLHPTVALGYPSQGDEKDTVPVPDPDGLSGFQGDAGSVKFVDGTWTGDKAIWLDYGNERKGRFVGLVNKDGSTKTECGIHVAGAEKTFDRDLWDGASKVVELSSQDAATGMKDGVMVVYAPWCQFCQAMEGEYEKLAAELAKSGVTVAKYRGDEDRDFVTANFNTESFPTINKIENGVATKYESEDRSLDALMAMAKGLVKA